VFKVDFEGGSRIRAMMKPGIATNNIGFSKHNSEPEGISAKPMLPLISSYDYYALDLIKAMKKLTQVKRELNKAWGGATSLAMSSGFDAFDFDDDATQ
jgi:hypothetical protein